MMRRAVFSACLLFGVAPLVEADTRYDLKREIAWARSKWPAELKGVRFDSPTAKLREWIPPGAKIQVWAFSPEGDCNVVELERITEAREKDGGDDAVLVGKSFFEYGFKKDGREFRRYRLLTFGSLFAQGSEALFEEERDPHGTWQRSGETGTIGRENKTYGALSYVDAKVARFGGTPVALHAECIGPIKWLPCRGGGEHPCVGCKEVALTAVEMDAHYDGMGFNWGRRQVTCHEACPRDPPNPVIARLDELQSHASVVWEPSKDPRNETPSLHRTQEGCLNAHRGAMSE